MYISTTKRIITTYITIGQTFGTWISPIFTGILLLKLRIVVSFFMLLDYIFFPDIERTSRNFILFSHFLLVQFSIFHLIYNSDFFLFIILSFIQKSFIFLKLIYPISYGIRMYIIFFRDLLSI